MRRRYEGCGECGGSTAHEEQQRGRCGPGRRRGRPAAKVAGGAHGSGARFGFTACYAARCRPDRLPVPKKPGPPEPVCSSSPQARAARAARSRSCCSVPGAPRVQLPTAPKRWGGIDAGAHRPSRVPRGLPGAARHRAETGRGHRVRRSGRSGQRDLPRGGAPDPPGPAVPPRRTSDRSRSPPAADLRRSTGIRRSRRREPRWHPSRTGPTGC